MLQMYCFPIYCMNSFFNVTYRMTSGATSTRGGINIFGCQKRIRVLIDALKEVVGRSY